MRGLLTPPLLRLIVANMAFMTGAMSLLFLNAYLEECGMAKSQIGFAEGAFWITSVVIQPWLGPALDRIGRARFMQAGAGLLTLACMLYALVPVSLSVVLPVRILQGAGFAIYLTAAWAWVSDHAPADKVHSVFALFGVSSLVGGVAGPAVATVLHHEGVLSDEVRMFWAAATLTGFATCASLSLRDAAHAPVPTFNLDEEPVVEGMPEPPPGASSASLFAIAARPRLRLVTLGSLSFGLTVGSLFAFAAIYLQGLGIDKVIVSGFLIVLTLVAGVGRAIVGPLASRWGAANLIAPSMLGLGLGCLGLGSMFWLAKPLSLMILLAAGSFAGFGYGVVYPVLNALAVERLDADERGRGVSLVAAAVDSGNFCGAALAGVLAEAQGDHVMFLVMGVAAGSIAVLARALDRPPAAL